MEPVPFNVEVIKPMNMMVFCVNTLTHIHVCVSLKNYNSQIF
jgi:hypothetical protein